MDGYECDRTVILVKDGMFFSTRFYHLQRLINL